VLQPELLRYVDRFNPIETISVLQPELLMCVDRFNPI